MPCRDGVARGPGSELRRVGLGRTSSRVRVERKLAYLLHAELSFSSRPSGDGFDRLARALVLRPLFHEKRQKLLRSCRRPQRQRPVPPRLARHATIVLHLRRLPCSHSAGRSAAAHAFANGMRTTNVVPSPSSDSKSIVPPCSATMAFAMYRPSPMPSGCIWLAFEPRQKRS